VVATWIAIALAGMVTAAYGSRLAVGYAAVLAQGLKVPPYLIGIAVLSIGTDIPEIANSILASAAGHGDLNVGDSVGSVATQITLGLAVIGLVGGSFHIGPRRVLPVTLLTMLALVTGAVVMSDGWLSRADAGLLLAAWVAGTVLIWKSDRPLAESLLDQPAARPALLLVQALGALTLVGAGAGAVVRAVIELSSLVGIPEYLISFFATSVGTSLPEVVVDISAIRAGRRDLALGDVLGSCFVDGTLSIGIGPLLFPGAVTARLAVHGAFSAIAVVALATFLLLGFRRLDRRVSLLLLASYLLLYVSFLTT
jgi:cation:H+ antiporter